MLVVVAGPLIAVQNRRRWFLADEFVFLFDRTLGDPASWFTPHWGHLTALPIVPYQVLYTTVGMHHYWPYQWLAIGVHLVVTVLARRLMRLAGVEPWLATAAVVPLLFLGTGRENLAWGFQITLTGGLAFGFGALVLLAGPRGSTGRARVTAGALLVGAVLCSNVGIVMVAVTAVTMVLIHVTERARRSPRELVVQLATVLGPAIAVYAAWVVLAPPSEHGWPTSAPDTTVRFAVRVLVGAAEGYSQYPLAALVLSLAVVTGFALLTRRVLASPEPTPGALVALALAAGSLLTVLLLGYGRAADAFVTPRTSRYVHLVVALAIVPMAAAMQELVRRHGVSALVAACLLLLVGLPGNVRALESDSDPDRSGSAAETAYMAELVTRSDLPDDEVIWGEITAGGLRAARRDGRMPTVTIDPDTASQATLKVSLRLGAMPDDVCDPVDEGRPVALRAGDRLVYRSGISVQHASDDGPRGDLTLGARGAQDVLQVRRDVRLWVSSPADDPVRRCP